LSDNVPVTEGGEAILAGTWPSVYQNDLQAFYNLQHLLRKIRKSAKDKKTVLTFAADRDAFVAGIETAIENLKDRSVSAAGIQEMRELWNGSADPGQLKLEDLITFVRPSELKAYAAGRGAAILHSEIADAVDGINLVISPEALKRELSDARFVTALFSELPFNSITASILVRGEELSVAAVRLTEQVFQGLSISQQGNMLVLNGSWEAYLQNEFASGRVFVQSA
jgi:hypothetical protein